MEDIKRKKIGIKSSSKDGKSLKETEKQIIYRKILRLGLVGITLFMLGFVSLVYGIYFANWQNFFVERSSSIFPFPIASVGGKNFVFLDDYLQNNKSIKKFLESKEATRRGSGFDFASEDGLKRLAVVKKNVLEELIENKIIKILAEEKGIRFNLSQAQDTARQIIERDGKREDNLTTMKFLYGWNEADFALKVVLPLLYREKLEEVVREKEYLDLDSENKVAEIKKRLEKGENFSALAETFSDSPSKRSGGLLPSFSIEEVPFEELKPVFDWSVGKTGDPFETEEGWHFIKLEKKFQEDGKNKIEIRHILILRKPFSAWLEEKKKDFKVAVMLPNYYWHQKMGKLYFKDDKMNEFELKFNQSYYEGKLEEIDLLVRTSGSK